MVKILDWFDAKAETEIVKKQKTNRTKVEEMGILIDTSIIVDFPSAERQKEFLVLQTLTR